MTLWSYVTGAPWMIEPHVGEQMRSILNRHFSGHKLTAEEVRAVLGTARRMRIETDPDGDDQVDAADQGIGPDPAVPWIGEGVAVIGVRGLLARYADQLNDASQPRGRSYEQLGAAIGAVREAAGVRTVILRIDSPGGTVQGLWELLAQVELLAEDYRLLAYVDGFTASAGYALAAACDEVVASDALALCGSVGALMLGEDDSAAQEMSGRVLKVWRSTPARLKAPGIEGHYSAEHSDEMQRKADSAGLTFLRYVVNRRNLTDEQAAAVASGAMWDAPEAQRLGLVDRVQSWSDLLADATTPDDDEADASGRPLWRRPTHASSNHQPAAAPAQREGMGMNEEILALIADHKGNADIVGLITDQAGRGASVDAIQAAVRDAQAQQEHDALVARAEQAEQSAADLQGTIETLQQQLAEAEQARAELQGTCDALESRINDEQGLEAGAGEDPGPGAGTGSGEKVRITRAQIAAGLPPDGEQFQALREGRAEIVED